MKETIWFKGLPSLVDVNIVPSMCQAWNLNLKESEDRNGELSDHWDPFTECWETRNQMYIGISLLLWWIENPNNSPILLIYILFYKWWHGP